MVPGTHKRVVNSDVMSALFRTCDTMTGLNCPQRTQSLPLQRLRARPACLSRINNQQAARGALSAGSAQACARRTATAPCRC